MESTVQLSTNSSDIVLPLKVSFNFYLVLMFLYSLGAVGNILSIIVFSRKAFRDSPACLSHQLLCMLDTVYMGIVSWGITLIHHQIILTKLVCLLLLYLMHVINIICNWMVVIVTAERLTCVVQPLRVRILCTKKRILVLFFSLISFTIIIYSGLFYMDTNLNTMGNNASLVFVCLYHFDDSYLEMTRTWLEIIFMHCLPCILLVLSNFLIIFYLKKSKLINYWNKTATKVEGKFNTDKGIDPQVLDEYKTGQSKTETTCNMIITQESIKEIREQRSDSEVINNNESTSKQTMNQTYKSNSKTEAVDHPKNHAEGHQIREITLNATISDRVHLCNSVIQCHKQINEENITGLFILSDFDMQAPSKMRKSSMAETIISTLSSINDDETPFTNSNESHCDNFPPTNDHHPKSSQHTCDNVKTKKQQIISNKQHRERTMTVTLVLINFTFLATKAPYFIHGMTLKGFSNIEKPMNSSDTEIKFGFVILASLFNTVSFLLYCMAGSRFREEFKNLIREQIGMLRLKFT